MHVPFGIFWLLQRFIFSCIETGCNFSYTQFVEYECLIKSRKSDTELEIKLKDKLRKEINKGKFKRFNISIDDLQEIELLEKRKKLGMGELSSIAFAKKVNHAFLTDDKTARTLANAILGEKMVQTTPHLVGYLFYIRILIDSDLSFIISEHNSSFANQWGRLDVYFNDVYLESMRIRLMI